MSASVERLDPLTFPLHGSRLIEASAGTGKTYTLAMLYLRLTLGHGAKMAYTRPLLPPEILVVTFTNAATDELRERIRHRLVEAAALFRGQITEDQVDALLVRLRDEMADQDSALCARQLESAAEWMDESAISTIHAWCYRMLREHAFDSGNAFEQQLENNHAELLQQATEDYWRCFYVGLELEDLRLVDSHWQTPAELLASISGLLPHAALLAPALPPQQTIRHCRTVTDGCVGALKTQWREAAFADALETLFDAAAKRKAFSQQKLNRGHRGKVLAELRDWMDSPDQIAPDIFGGHSWRRMSSLGVAEIWTDTPSMPSTHPACLALAELHAQLSALPDPHHDLLTHAVHWIETRVEQEKQRRGVLTQRDLLVRLDRALQSERGAQLARAIRAQFPVALVDEFQDTDPIQYRIFDAIYRVAKSDPATGFFMIGDPKQAIYGFRGADIHTYLTARAQTGRRHYTLDTNYRSCGDLIGAVNGLFEFGEQGAERGAFLFRQEAGNPVPFLPVTPRFDPGGTLELDGQRCPPLQVWLVEEKITKTAYAQQMATAAAREIAALLKRGQSGRALLPDGQGRQRAVVPGDMAVLVNTRGEADLVRAELRRLGVASVYLSERNTVFASTVAGELTILLRAIANPLDEWLLRQALASPLLGLGLEALDRLNRDELYWEAQGEAFRAYHLLWKRRGVLALLYRLIAHFQTATRLLRTPGGERELTDLLHLGELLQTASEQLDGEQALVRHLEACRAEVDGTEASEARQLRLESDEHLVRVVTIHKSKGLEYPLVFLPFIVNCRRAKSTDLPLATHDAERNLLIHLGGDEAIVAQADTERLGEDLRKLYVALTRARYATWLGVAPTSDLSGSALAYLLGTDGDDLADCLRQPGCLTISVMPPVDPEPYHPSTPAALDPARAAPKLRLKSWWITSYTALRRTALPRPDMDMDAAEDATRLLPELGQTPDTAVEEIALEETDQASAQSETLQLRAGVSLHALPKGSRQGTFLHGVLEWAARVRTRDAAGQPLRGFAGAVQASEARREMLAQRCNLRRLTEWIDPLDAWLVAFLQRQWVLHDLPDTDGRIPTLALIDLPPQRIQVEMAFWLESRGVDIGMLEQLIHDHVLAGQARPGLRACWINGMLRGFIDLLFEHDGRYYVVDWKSNWLGPDDTAYQNTAMRTAMLQARYDLQYVLYLLALHRQLRARLPGYDYDRHIGGAIYVFLRGSDAQSQGLFMDKPPRRLIETLDRMFAGETPAGQEGQA